MAGGRQAESHRSAEGGNNGFPNRGVLRYDPSEENKEKNRRIFAREKKRRQKAASRNTKNYREPSGTYPNDYFS